MGHLFQDLHLDSQMPNLPLQLADLFFLGILATPSQPQALFSGFNEAVLPFEQLSLADAIISAKLGYIRSLQQLQYQTGLPVSGPSDSVFFLWICHFLSPFRDPN